MATYQGKKLTGTASGKAFQDIEFSDFFYVGDIYKNTETGHVYKCSSEGWASAKWWYDSSTDKWKRYNAAKWSYDHSVIVKKPTATVASLTAPARDGNVFESKWKVPSNMTDTKSGKRATSLKRVFKVNYADGKDITKSSKIKTLEFSKSLGTKDTSATLNINSKSVKIGKKLGRGCFWPVSEHVIKSISITVYGVNKEGTGEGASATLSVGEPHKPTVGEPTIILEGEGAGEVSCAITPAESTNARERFQTHWEMRYKNVMGANKWETKLGHVKGDSEFTVSSRDFTGWQDTSKHYVVEFRSRSEGWGGNSGFTSWKRLCIGYPLACTLGDLQNVDGTKPNSYGFLNIKDTNSRGDYHTQGTVLQKMQSTSKTIAEADAADPGEWTDTEAVDDGDSKGLSFLISDVMPREGYHTYLRVRSWNHAENSIFQAYSKAVELKQLFKAVGAEDNKCAIIGDPVSARDGSGIYVTVAWDRKSEEGDDDTTSMQIAYADDPEAWTSDDVPDPFEFTWQDEEVDPSAAATWRKTARVKLKKNIEEGKTYWFKARCIVDKNDIHSEGEWCDAKQGVLSAAAVSASLSAPAVVAVGRGVPFSWGFSGGSTQTSWQLLLASDGKTAVAKGDGGIQSTTVEANRAATYAVDSVLSVFVRVATSGGTVDSAPVSVLISDAPVASVGAIGNLAAQPLSIPLACDTAGCPVSIIVSADGCTTGMPYGTVRQAAGDTVWSAASTPEWTLNPSTGMYEATVTLPDTLDFIDEAPYTVEVIATDPVTGLPSESVRSGFDVAWAHQAPIPPEFGLTPTTDTTIVPGKTYYAYDDEADEYLEVDEPSQEDIASYYEETGVRVEAAVSTDDEGNVSRTATITLEAPQGAVSTDVYDVYRVTGDGAQLIAEGRSLDDSITDVYAPFGLGTYRVATRTIDGDVAWRDYEYRLDGPGLRFDFEGEEHDYVELPWNVTAQESYAKDFRLSKGMDGTRAGGWNLAVEKTGTFQTDIIKVMEEEKINAVRDLGRYAGAVFVRTSAGLAFAANVNVDSMDMEYGSRGIAVSFSATEIDQDERFMAALPEESADALEEVEP